MRRKVSVFIIIAICFLLQTTLFQALSFASISPNLLIIVVSSFGFMRGKKEVFNPELVIIGGTLSLTGDYIAQPIKTAVRKYSLNLVNKDSAILTSKLKDKAGIVGACMLARSRMFED